MEATNLDERLLGDSVFSDPLTGTAVISSTSLAARLGRSHKHILSKIGVAEKCCSRGFYNKHFIRQGSLYWLTRDGLMLTTSCMTGGAYMQKCLATLLERFEELETNEQRKDNVKAVYWQRVLADTVEEKNLVTRQRDYYRRILPERKYTNIAYVSV